MGVNSAIRLLGKTKKLADDVVEAGARNTSKGNLIKNTTTQLSSNLTPNQMKTMRNAGKEVVESARNGARNASRGVVSHNTTSRTLNQIGNGNTVSFSVANSKNVGNSLPNNKRAAIAASRGQVSYNTTNRAQQELAMSVEGNVPKVTQPTLNNSEAEEFTNLLLGGRSNPNAPIKSQHIPMYRQSQLNQTNLNTPKSINFNSNIPTSQAVNSASGLSSDEMDEFTNLLLGGRSNPTGPVKSQHLPIQRQSQLLNNQSQTLQQSLGGGPNQSIQMSPFANNLQQRLQNLNQQWQQAQPQVGPIINNATNQMGGSFVDIDAFKYKDANLSNGPFDLSTLNQNRLKTMDMDDVIKLGPDVRDPFGTGFDAKGTFTKVKDFANEYMFGGFTDTYKNMKGGQGFTDAVTNAFTDENGNIRWGRAAGAYVTASAGLRLLSGGGVTRDRNGNSNMIGVPFI